MTVTGMNPADFWAPWEEEADSFTKVIGIIHDVFDKWSAKGRLFAWRGQVDADWPLHSALYRRLLWTEGGAGAPDERALRKRERTILADVHRWGLHMGAHGRLSFLNQLAVLQHYGTPTRLIDVTFNPLIGLWFAVEKQWENGGEKNEDRDGRLFAIDVTDRLINENKKRRSWEDQLPHPWPSAPGKGSSKKRKDEYRTWQTSVLAWRPPRFDSRIAAQNGGFIFGGVPISGTSAHPAQWPKGTSPPKDGWWKIDEVRRATSAALRVHKIVAGNGGVTSDAVYTIRIKAKAKKDVCKRLEDLYGYRHATIYPDYTGFALFGTPDLKSRP